MKLLHMLQTLNAAVLSERDGSIAVCFIAVCVATACLCFFTFPASLLRFKMFGMLKRAIFILKYENESKQGKHTSHFCFCLVKS